MNRNIQTVNEQRRKIFIFDFEENSGQKKELTNASPFFKNYLMFYPKATLLNSTIFNSGSADLI